MKTTNHKFRTFAKLGSPSPEQTDLASKKFEDVVKFQIARLKGDKAQAVAFCVKHYPAKHAEYLARVHAGEVIMF